MSPCLAQDNNIWFDILMIHSQHPPCPTEASLDLVSYPQDIVLCAQFPRIIKMLVYGN